MNVHDVVNRYSARPGFEAVEYFEVALPVYILNLRVIVLSHKPVPPIEEFVLRCLASGLTKEEEIRACLGLEEVIVRSALINLVQAESVVLGPDSDTRKQVLSMTSKGSKVLETAEVITPEEKSVSVEFDGLSRTISASDRQQLLQPREAKDGGLVEIPTVPARKPLLTDFSAADIERVLRAQTGPHGKRDLIAIRGIERSTRVFRPAIAIIFKALHGSDIQVAFAVGGRLSPEYEEAFARLGGISRIAAPENYDTQALKEQLTALDITPTDEQELRHLSLVRGIEKCHQRIDELRSRETDADKQSVDQRCAELHIEIQDHEASIANIPRRRIRSYEHPAYLSRALSGSRRRIFITSRSLSPTIVNRDFFSALEKLDSENVQITIGIDEQGKRTQPKKKSEIIAALCQFARGARNCRITTGSLLCTVLVTDELAIVGNFDWLGFEGARPEVFGVKSGVILSDPDDIDRLMQMDILLSPTIEGIASVDDREP